MWGTWLWHRIEAWTCSIRLVLFTSKWFIKIQVLLLSKVSIFFQLSASFIIFICFPANLPLPLVRSPHNKCYSHQSYLLPVSISAIFCLSLSLTAVHSSRCPRLLAFSEDFSILQFIFICKVVCDLLAWSHSHIYFCLFLFLLSFS